MNDNSSNVVDLAAARTSHSEAAFASIAAMIEKRGAAGVTPEIRALLDGLGAEHVDHSDPEFGALIDEFTITSEDGIITLTYGVTPAADGGFEKGFTMHRYKLEQSQRWDYDVQPL